MNAVDTSWEGARVRFNFDYLGLRVDVAPAVEKLNPIYRAAVLHYIVGSPRALAAFMERLPESQVEELLIPCYARGGVIVGSPDAPYDAWGDDEWESWLLTHRDEFRAIRSVAEHAQNWDPKQRAENADRERDRQAQQDHAQPDQRG